MAEASVKVAISLPASLLKATEHEREITGESRSEFIRKAIEMRLRREREREAVTRYVEGYQRVPETDDDVAIAESLGAIAVAREPW